MAKITVVGNAIVITSSAKLEEIKLVEKYRPEVLTLMSGEDNKDPVFRVCSTTGTGNISKYGAEFGQETRDSEKNAVITLGFEANAEDLKKAVVDAIGSEIINLTKVEKNISSVIEEIKNEEQSVLDAITIL